MATTRNWKDEKEIYLLNSMLREPLKTKKRDRRKIGAKPCCTRMLSIAFCFFQVILRMIVPDVDHFRSFFSHTFILKMVQNLTRRNPFDDSIVLILVMSNCGISICLDKVSLKIVVTY